MLLYNVAHLLLYLWLLRYEILTPYSMEYCVLLTLVVSGSSRTAPDAHDVAGFALWKARSALRHHVHEGALVLSAREASDGVPRRLPRNQALRAGFGF